MLIFMLIVAVVSAAAAVTLTLLGFTRWFIVGLAAVLLTFGITPLTVNIGEGLAREAASTYNEYYNGFELAATSDVRTCTQDGACAHEYDCDPYTVVESYTTTNSKGESEVKTRLVTKYHACPYSTQETSYYVDTTLGQYTIAASLMTGRPWRSGEAIPGGRQSAPVFWQHARQRLAANNPGPVTQVNTYRNFILASQTNLFKRYSGTIKTLVSRNLLPAPVSGTTGYYDAAKAYFAGTLPGGFTRQNLTRDVAYLNGAVGTKLQGDVHIVFVNAAQAPEPTVYLNSLMAYWQSPTFGRNAISKNSIVIVVGVGTAAQIPATQAPSTAPTPAPITAAPLRPSQPVALWVRAATGMPIGNAAMLLDLRNQLRDQPINANFIGRPGMDVRTRAITRTDGLIEGVLFGQHRFQRVSMSADGKVKGAGLGYHYLENGIPVPAGAYVAMAFIVAILGAGLLLLAAYLSAMLSASTTFRYTSRRYTSRGRRY